MESKDSPSTGSHSEVPRRPSHSNDSLRWLNGSVHWISAIVLVYAFVNNGKTTHALVNPSAMREEVKFGLVVGLIFLVRLIWVQSRSSGGGRWIWRSFRAPQTKIRRITNWGIYLAVAGSVVSGLLIAYLRPGAELIPDPRGFMTSSSPALNAAMVAHAFVSVTLEWLCAFHVLQTLWRWLRPWMRRSISNVGWQN